MSFVKSSRKSTQPLARPSSSKMVTFQSNQASLDAWIPDSFLRPTGYTTDFQEAFRSGACYLAACFLHSAPNESYIDRLSEIISSFTVSTPAHMSDARTQQVIDALDQRNPWIADVPIANNSVYLGVYFEEYDSLSTKPTEDVSLGAVIVSTSQDDFTPDTSYDRRLINVMRTMAEVELDTIDDALPVLEALYALWRDVASEPTFCVGRGSTFYGEVQRSQIMVLRDDAQLYESDAILAAPFVIYDMGENFDFRSITRGLKRGFDFAKDLARTASKLVFSNTGDVLTMPHVGAFLNTLGAVESAIPGIPLMAGLGVNLARSGISHLIRARTNNDEKASDGLPGNFASFFLRKARDNTYNPVVGRSGATDTTQEAWRGNVDALAMRMARAAANMFSRQLSLQHVNGWSNAVEALHRLKGDLNLTTTEFLGRGPGRASAATTNQASSSTYIGDYWESSKDELIDLFNTDAVNVATDDGRAAALAAMTMGGNPFAWAPSDVAGDLPDLIDLQSREAETQRLTQDMDNLQGRVSRLQTTNQELRTSNSQLLTQYQTALRELDQARASPGIPAPPIPTSVPMSTQSQRYINWEAAQSEELIAAINSKWMNIQDAFELIDTLNECNFKYDTARDAAREALTGDQFLMKIQVSYFQRFPDGVALVCQNHNDITSAISDVLAALNYRNDEDVRGARTTEQRPKVRETNSYNDAALNYVKSVSTLSNVFKRCAVTRSKFERRYGLHWFTG